MKARLLHSFKALRELGPGQLALYGWYRLGLKTGYLRRRTKGEGRKPSIRPSPFALRPVLELPGREQLDAALGDCAAGLMMEAEEILAGQVRLFAGPPVPLKLHVPGELGHWTVYEKGNRGVGERGGQGSAAEDIKFIWEPGRFGWAYTLCRAYHLSGEERFSQAFWSYAEEFLERNPAYLGPHWASAQEAALRLVALVFAAQVFARSPASTPEREELLAQAVAEHAARIPPTLAYARAQFNNHLLSEALGLYTAGAALPDHPRADGWRALGWHWLQAGFQSQIDPDGAYIQHSANYQRLMLQHALWASRLARVQGQEFPRETRERLVAATCWLLALVDPDTGRVPNLGPNDGAYIQRLASCPFDDYRPVLQAAALEYLGERAFPPGPWDEMALWLAGSRGAGEKGNRGAGDERCSPAPLFPFSPAPVVLRSPRHPSWAYLRAARFRSRPGHADQLHLDLWWRGLNLAQDAGTYLYNGAPPWDNALSATAVHNTLAINGQDQMTRAGRFLWLDWAQAQVLLEDRGKDGSWERVIAQHDGYRRLGLVHRREVRAHPEGRWSIIDSALPVTGFASLQVEGSRFQVTQSPDLPPSTFKPATNRLPTSNLQPSNLTPVSARLHWLLPDWPWELERGEWSVEIRLASPHGMVLLRVLDGEQSRISTLHSRLQVQIVRAGELLFGSGPVHPTWGWVSPTYGQKLPALSFSVAMESSPPVTLISEWFLP